MHNRSATLETISKIFLCTKLSPVCPSKISKIFQSILRSRNRYKNILRNI
eukprot:UN13891